MGDVIAFRLKKKAQGYPEEWSDERREFTLHLPSGDILLTARDIEWFIEDSWNATRPWILGWAERIRPGSAGQANQTEASVGAASAVGRDG